jgi:serine protease Do
MRSVTYLASFLAAISMALPPAFSQVTRSRTYAVQAAGTSYLGIGVVDVTPDMARTLNLKEVRGAEVSRLEENSPAAKAGVREGDVVLEYNGNPVEGGAQFARMVRETPVGRSVKLTVWRNGAAQSLMVTVGERQGTVLNTPGGTIRIPEMPPIEIPRFEMSWQNSMLGIEGESLGVARQLAEFFGVRDGVLVRQVLRNTPAEKSGLKAGDVITRVDGANVGSTREITAQLRSAARTNRTVTLTVVRDKREMPITVTLDQAFNPAAPGDRF